MLFLPMQKMKQEFMDRIIRMEFGFRNREIFATIFFILVFIYVVTACSNKMNMMKLRVILFLKGQLSF